MRGGVVRGFGRRHTFDGALTETLGRARHALLERIGRECAENRAAARQYTDASVTKLLLMGAGASVPGLREHMTKELSLETSPVAPRDLTECPPALLEACASPEMTPALGLAQFPET